MKIRIIISALLISIFLTPLAAQVKESEIEVQIKGDSIRVESTREYFLKVNDINNEVNILFPQIVTSTFPYIQVLVSVTDESGEPITGLSYQNFQIRENQQQVKSFSLQEHGASNSINPVAIALVIDVSGSMSSTDMAYARNAAKEFVNNMRAYDRAAIVKFSGTALVVQTMTSNKALLNTAINGLTASGSTAMYDGFYLGIQQCAPEVGIKAVIGFTDGDNNAGSYNQSHVINYANQVGLPLYSIGVGSINATPLQQMAAATGGSYYYAPSPAQIGQIYDQISQNIESQYQIVFMTPDISMDGTSRVVEVTVTLD